MIFTVAQQEVSRFSQVFIGSALQAGSSSEAILNAMSQELVPASPQALEKEKGELVLSG